MDKDLALTSVFIMHLQFNQILYFTSGQTAKKLTQNLARQAVIASYFIFLNRNETDWNNNVY